MKFADFPFLRYLPFLVLGVLISGEDLGIPLWIPVSGIGLGFVWYLFLVSKEKSTDLLRPALLGYVMLLLTGFFLSEVQKHNSEESHDPRLSESIFYIARVQKHDIRKTNSFENQLEVIALRDSLGWYPSKGKVLIYHQGKTPLRPGQVIRVEKSPESIPPPTFPNEFDYKGFLARSQIHYRQFVGDRFVVVDSAEVRTSAYWLENFRKKLVGIIDAKVPHPESKQIASALLLGQQQELDKEIRNAYAETGTMHILAVSGLHVGIIYAILLFPLKGIRLKKTPRKIYLVAVVLLIWMYALLTGFSPSVIRAATMFSLFTAGQMRERKPSSFNILAFSAILMIAFDPGVIYEVGFQLSYLAVGGILLLQPLILRWWLPPNQVLEYIWQLTAVSLAAQLATFPLSIYYFHIFPSYFLIANLVIIPLSFLVMQAGIPLLIFSWVPFLGDGLGWLVSWMIWLQNWITFTIQLLPGGNLDRLTIHLAGMILVWALLIFWGNWEFGDRKKMVIAGAILLLIWSGDRIVREMRQPSEELLIFSGEKGMLMDFRVGNKFFSWNPSLPPEQIPFSLDPNRIAQHRPQIPESAIAIENGQAFWFPIWDFQFDPGKRQFTWGNRIPKRVEQISTTSQKELSPSDSLFATFGAFRVVF
jgi:competence protein ComEC